MSPRRTISRSVETEVLLGSRRRCCLCVFLHERDDIRKGQIAHLNRNPGDARFDNLVWLCLEHHDDFDSRTSQAKGFTPEEIRRYRNRLYKRHTFSLTNAEDAAKTASFRAIPTLSPTSDYERLKSRFHRELEFTSRAWRYPLWQIANEPEFFAFKASNRADGVCLIERIDLPDDRIVIACMQVGGNPGNSITNCVEELCFQVCERFEIPADRLVWLEHYDYGEDGEWDRVTFAKQPPKYLFEEPKWTEMTPDMWAELRLKPRKKLVRSRGNFLSKLTKCFPWP